MVNWDLYEKRLMVDGDSLREREINSMVDAVMNDFKDTPSYRESKLSDSQGIDIQVINTIHYNVKDIIVYPGSSINIGDILEFDNGKWLCLEADKTNPVNETGRVYLCDNVFTFHKPFVSPTPIDVPYVTYDSIALTRMGLDTNKGYVITPNSRMMIAVSNNSVTRHILRNDKYVFYGDDVYRVIDLNHVRNPGLIILELDYYAAEEPEPLPPSPTLPSIGYVIDGSAEIKVGQTLTYIARKYVEKEDDEGNISIEEDTSAKFDFTIIADDVPDSAYTLTVVSDNTCTVKCNKFPYYITLRATDMSSNKFTEKQIKLKTFL